MARNIFSGGQIKSNGEILEASQFNGQGVFGDGSDGSYTSGNNLEPGKVYNFTDFTLQSGDTLTSTTSSGEPIIVKVSGDVDISGTIDLKGMGYQGAQVTSVFDREKIGSGLQDLFLTFSEAGGDERRTHVNHGTGGLSAYQQGGGDSFQGVGEGGVKYPVDKYMDASRGFINVLSGTGGGAGNRGTDDEAGPGGGGGASYGASGEDGSDGGTNTTDFGDSEPGAGGDGGGSMIILCSGSFTLNGTIDIRGNDGEDGEDDPDSAGGGGGGGGGGMFYGIYKGSLSDTGTKLISGGAGGAGGSANANGGDGGAGANGAVVFESV